MIQEDAGAGWGYELFGLYLWCETDIPGLQRRPPKVDLPEFRLHSGSLPLDFDPEQYPDRWYETDYKSESGEPFFVIEASLDRPASYWFRYIDEHSVNVIANAASRDIWLTWAAGSSLEDALTYLLGPVLTLFCQILGVFCLHGSAVAIDGKMIALLGYPGAGKSTTAAAFAGAGFPIAADDVVLLSPALVGFSVAPSYPVLRLWPSSVEIFYGDGEALPRLSPSWEKRGLNLDGGGYRYQSESLPLGAIYILGERSDQDAPRVEPVSGVGAVLAMIPHSWARSMNALDQRTRQFRVLGQLSQCTPIRQLVAHQDSSRIAGLCQLIVADLAELGIGSGAAFEP